MLRPYPTSLPPEVWSVISNVLQGQVGDVPHAVHCVEDAIAFGLGQFLPDNKPQGSASALRSNEAVADERLKAVVAALADGKHQGLIPWASLLPYLITILEDLLAKLQA